MAATAIPFVAGNVTPADILLDMLDAVTSKPDFRIWAGDLIAFKHLLSVKEDRNLTHLGATRWCELDREAA